MNYLQAAKSIYFAIHNVPIWNIGKNFLDYIVSFPSDEGNKEKMFQSSDDNLTELQVTFWQFPVLTRPLLLEATAFSVE